jgi:hypothetical protein
MRKGAQVLIAGQIGPPGCVDLLALSHGDSPTGRPWMGSRFCPPPRPRLTVVAYILTDSLYTVDMMASSMHRVLVGIGMVEIMKAQHSWRLKGHLPAS